MELKKKGKYTLCDFASTSTRRGSREGKFHVHVHASISNISTYISTQQPRRLRRWLSRKHAHEEKSLTIKQQRSGHRCPMTKWQDASADLRSCLQVQCWPVNGVWKHSLAVYVINYYGKLLSTAGSRQYRTSGRGDRLPTSHAFWFNPCGSAENSGQYGMLHMATFVGYGFRGVLSYVTSATWSKRECVSNIQVCHW